MSPDVAPSWPVRLIPFAETSFKVPVPVVVSLRSSSASVVMLIAELFNDVLITTNYDQLIEQSFQIGSDVKIQ